MSDLASEFHTLPRALLPSSCDVLSPAQEAVGDPGPPSALFVSLLGTVSTGQDLGLLQP